MTGGNVRLRRAYLKHSMEKLALAVWFKLPKRLRHMFVFSELGYLVMADPRLHTREVPTITVDEFVEAAKVA